jgi:phenylpropionate dioxygenase-like ring-hydroxylating dioxygenase large terminal subunit
MIFNQWYVVLESKELKKYKPLRIKRFIEDLALWHDENGRANWIADYEKLFHLQFYYPNIWQNHISDKIKTFAAFVPVDEENSIVYIRYYQKLVKIPLLKELFNYIGKISSIIILRQDKRVVTTQLPKKSALKMNELLIMGDKPIIEYRKHREELMGNSRQSSVVSR